MYLGACGSQKNSEPGAPHTVSCPMCVPEPKAPFEEQCSHSQPFPSPLEQCVWVLLPSCYVCTMCWSSMGTGQIRVSDAVELELQTAVSHHMDAGIEQQPMLLATETSSPDPSYLF